MELIELDIVKADDAFKARRLAVAKAKNRFEARVPLAILLVGMSLSTWNTRTQ